MFPRARRNRLLCVCLAAFYVGFLAQNASAGDPPVNQANPAAAQQEIMISVVVARTKGNLVRTFATQLLKHPEKNQKVGADASRVYVGILESVDTSDAFVAFLRTLREEEMLQVLAEPTYTTQSGHSASLLCCGGERAIPVAVDVSGSVGVQFEEIGLRLDLLPTLLANGRIQLVAEVAYSALEPGHQVKPQEIGKTGVCTIRVNTTRKLEDGQTLLIGGLSEPPSVETYDIPVLSRIPVMGKVFRAGVPVKKDEEIVVMVTVLLVHSPMQSEQTTVPANISSGPR